MQPIPVSTAQKIAEDFGYNQVIIVARKVGENGGEHLTTYGTDAANKDAAAKIGDFLKFKVMGWKDEQVHEDFRRDALLKIHNDLAAEMARHRNTVADIRRDGDPDDESDSLEIDLHNASLDALDIAWQMLNELLYPPKPEPVF